MKNKITKLVRQITKLLEEHKLTQYTIEVRDGVLTIICKGGAPKS